MKPCGGVVKEKQEEDCGEHGDVDPSSQEEQYSVASVRTSFITPPLVSSVGVQRWVAAKQTLQSSAFRTTAPRVRPRPAASDGARRGPICQWGGARPPARCVAHRRCCSGVPADRSRGRPVIAEAAGRQFGEKTQTTAITPAWARLVAGRGSAGWTALRSPPRSESPPAPPAGASADRVTLSGLHLHHPLTLQWYGNTGPLSGLRPLRISTCTTRGCFRRPGYTLWSPPAPPAHLAVRNPSVNPGGGGARRRPRCVRSLRSLCVPQHKDNYRYEYQPS
ncbi:unnamed protein product [Boreogadus saida]